MKLSIGMIVKNEEKYLEKCLIALQPIINNIETEIIIVDTGSTDKTINIAQKFTDKVYVHKWNNDFSEARNISIEKSSGDWFFYLDADEILEDVGNLIDFFKSGLDKIYNVVSINLKNITKKYNENHCNMFSVTRIIKNKNICFKGIIHEQIHLNEETRVYVSSARFNHYGYISDDKKLMEYKFNRNLALLKEAIKREPQNEYHYFQMSVTYSMHMDYQDALESAEKAYCIIKSKKIISEECIFIYGQLANAYNANKRYTEAKEICLEIIKSRRLNYTSYIDIYFNLGLAQSELKEYEGAINSFLEYINLINKYNDNELIIDLKSGIASISNYEKILVKISEFYIIINNCDDAWNIIIDNEFKHEYAAALNQLCKISLKQDKLEGIIEYYLNFYKNQQLEQMDIISFCLETEAKSNKDLHEKIVYNFAGLPISDKYVTLNRVRREFTDYNPSLKNDVLNIVNNIDIAQCYYFYGEFIYYLMKQLVDVKRILSNISDEKCSELIYHVMDRYEDFSQIVGSYFKHFNYEKDLNSILFSRPFIRAIVVKEDLPKEEYMDLLNQYISEGIIYIEQFYNISILDSEKDNIFRVAEDKFFMYMRKAYMSKNKDDAKYISYLNKALKTYPNIKNGIEVLLDKFKGEHDNIRQKSSGENQMKNEKQLMEDYKLKVKENIDILIGDGKFLEASELLKEYEKIITDDIDVYSIKAIILIMENNLQIAEEVLLQGLRIDNCNFDILYNLAYVYKLLKDNEKAIIFYKEALRNCKENNNRGEIIEILKDDYGIVVNEIDKVDYNVNASINTNEFEVYMKKAKENIEHLINDGRLQEAKEIIIEYEEIVKNDVEILSMKGVILISENRLADAQFVMEQGLRIDNYNFDLLYNLGYLHQLKGDFITAIDYFKRSKEVTKNDKQIECALYSIDSIKMEHSEIVNKKHKTSIVILTFNQLEYTKLCIESIRKYTDADKYELIIVDNNSTDGTVEWIKQQGDLKVIFNNENFGFPKGCNQGIEISAGDSVLLLNNDVIVTPYWLDNLEKSLWSSSIVGAVGAVTNSSSYYQTIDAKYSTIEEMIQFASSYNTSDPAKWEQRIKLVGYCMLIKKSVIHQVGLLDERFTPGNFEDDDYSFRIINAGYKLLLCKDTFIHHFGSASFKKNPEQYNNLLMDNAKKFQKKWGFNPNYSTFIRQEVINNIQDPIDKDINVLEIGCACGATLLKIKDIYKNARIFGIELDESAAQIAKAFADVKAENIENENLSYEEEYFDYIIFADVLEHLIDPWKVLKNMKKYLKPQGKILASIPNVMHFSVIRGLLNGNWTYENAGILDKTHLRFFTLREIEKLFLNSGYMDIQCSSTSIYKNEADEKFINSLILLNNNPEFKNQIETYQYIVKATKLKELDRNIDSKQIYEKKVFLTLFPETENVHLTKDVGMIAFLMGKYYNYDSKIACYDNGQYPYLENELIGLKLDFIPKVTGDSVKDGYNYLLNNSSKIDVLQLFHLTDRTLIWIDLYKRLNPKGKIYLKLDANINITQLNIDNSVFQILKKCDLVTVETKYLYDFLNKKWPIKVEYIPNGFYDFNIKEKVLFKEKENTIITVGRIGLPVKANEILLEAFKLASSKINNWDLKIIGPIQNEFIPYLNNYFKENPDLRSKIVFTGEIVDKKILEDEYKRAKIFCLTSKIEGFPLVFPEAIKNGCYLISSNVLAATDITNNTEYGDIFKIDDIKELSELLIKRANDEIYLSKVCEKVQKFAYNKFNWKDICTKIYSFINIDNSITNDYE
jgi:GT2 family glycosyltransferase/glycosyltransferase involved in cell wall biosynthesis/Flp pilus assembly protein TadD